MNLDDMPTISEESQGETGESLNADLGAELEAVAQAVGASDAIDSQANTAPDSRTDTASTNTGMTEAMQGFMDRMSALAEQQAQQSAVMQQLVQTLGQGLAPRPVAPAAPPPPPDPNQDAAAWARWMTDRQIEMQQAHQRLQGEVAAELARLHNAQQTVKNEALQAATVQRIEAQFTSALDQAVKGTPHAANPAVRDYIARAIAADERIGVSSSMQDMVAVGREAYKSLVGPLAASRAPLQSPMHATLPGSASPGSKLNYEAMLKNPKSADKIFEIMARSNLGPFGR